MTTREQVEQVETKYDVQSIEVRCRKKTFQIYPWIKGRLFHKIITGEETMQKQNLKLYFNQFISVFYGLHNIFRKYDNWVFTSSMERRLINGKYTDKLFDSISNYQPKTLIIELRLFKFYPLRKIASKYVISRSFFVLFEVIYSKLFLKKIKISNPQLLTEINQLVQGGVQSDYIIRKYLAQYFVMKFWLKILPNPKVVFVSVSYTHFGYIRALKEKDIKIIEFQHGVITGNHHAYNYFKSFDSIQFPDSLVTFGEKEKEAFSSNKFPIKEIVPIGNYLVNHFAISKYESRNPIKILFTLQDGIMGEKLIRFILELKRKIPDSIRLIIQPRRTKPEVYCEKISEAINLEFSKEDFYSMLSKCTIHSTIYSTTAIESLSMGIPNILINFDNQSKDQLSNLISNPYTIFVENVSEFIHALGTLNKYDPQKIKESNAVNIKPGYDTNLAEFLRKIA